MEQSKLAFMKSFNIPDDLKCEHSPENLQKMKDGIAALKYLLNGTHDVCMEEVVTYAELNIRFFFASHLCDKELLKHAVELFIANISKMFNKPAEQV